MGQKSSGSVSAMIENVFDYRENKMYYQLDQFNVNIF